MCWWYDIRWILRHLNVAVFLFRPTGSMRYTSVNSKWRGDHSDHPALTRKTPTDTPLEVNSMIQSVLHTHRCTHTCTNRALCRWEAVWSSFNFNLCGAAKDTHNNNTAHLQCLCFLYSEPRGPSVKKGLPAPLQLETLIGTNPYSSRKLSTFSSVQLFTPWSNLDLPPALPLVLSYYVADVSVYVCAFVCVLQSAMLAQQHWSAKSLLPSPMINMPAYGGVAGTRGRSGVEICLWFN